MAEVIKTVVDVELNTGQFSSQLKVIQQQINAFNLTLNKNQSTQAEGSRHFANELMNSINRGKFFRAELVQMQNSARALDATLSKGQATLGQFFSAAFNKRSGMAAETFALSAERARTMQTQFIATGKASKGMQEAIAVRPLTAFSTQAAVSAQRMQILNSMFKQGTTQLINFGKNVQWAGRQLMVGFTVPLTIFGSIAGRVFRDLEKEAVNFKKVYGDIFTTPEEVNQNLDAVKELAKEFTKYGIAAKNTLELAALAAQSGKQGAELQTATIQATRLSILGDIDKVQSMKATIAMQSAFRMSNEELANSINFLNMVENSSVVSLENLTEAIPRVAPVIVGLGGDIKDMAVFLAAMQEGGVNAAEAANGLKSSLGRLITPAKAAKDMAGEFGISLENIVSSNEGNVLGMVISLSEAMKTLSDLQKQQLLSAVFGKFQFARMGALFENITREGSQAQQIIKMMDMSIEDMAATADKELGAIEDSVGTQFVGAMERLKLSIAPIGEIFVRMSVPIINFLTKIANWFSSLPEGVKNFASIATVIVGLIVPAATMMFGLFMNLVGTLAKMSQGVAIFGASLLKGGPIAALKSLGQSTKYLSLAEIDAANAARQLGSATGVANSALLAQVGSARSADAAIRSLTASYRMLIAEQMKSGIIQPQFFGVGRSASLLAKGIQKRNTGGKIFSLNEGNIVPGMGNTDTVPAMLTPGEFVINKEATKQNLNLLNKINNGNVDKFNKGGMIPGEKFIQPTNSSEDPKFKLPTQQQETIPNNRKVKLKSPRSLEGKFLNFSSETTKLQYEQAVKLLKTQEDTELFNEQLLLGQEERSKSQKKPRIDNKLLKRVIGNRFKHLDYIDTEKLFGPGKSLDKTHVQDSLRHVLTEDLFVSGKDGKMKTIPKGIPVKFINNKVIDLEKSLNLRLSKGGVSAKELLENFPAENNLEAKNKLFATTTGQFNAYLDKLNLDSGSRKSLITDYKNAEERVYQSYRHQLRGLGDKIITDSGSDGSVKLEQIANKAQSSSAIGSSKKLKDFDKLLNSYHHVRFGKIEDFHKQAAQLKIPNSATMQHYELLESILYSDEGNLDQGNLKKEIRQFLIENRQEATKGGGASKIGDPRARWKMRSFTPSLGNNIWDPKNRKTMGVSEDMARMLYSVLFRTRGAGVLARNKGGMIPDVQGLNIGGMAKAFQNSSARAQTLVPRAVREHMASKYPNMSPEMKKTLEQYVTDKRSSPMSMYTKSSEFIANIDAIMKNAARFGEKGVIDRFAKGRLELNGGGKVKLNKGSIVPGVGNTDTVPAMLTPGEFVINKESAQKNYDLLTAINDGMNTGGAVKKYNKGGMAKGVQFLNPGGAVKKYNDGGMAKGVQFLNPGGPVLGYLADGRITRDPAQARALAARGELFSDKKGRQPLHSKSLENRIKSGGVPPQTTKATAASTSRKVTSTPSRGGGTVGMIAGTAASLPFFGMQEQLGQAGSIAASLAAYSVVSKGVTAAMLKLKGQAITTSALFPMLSKTFPTLSKSMTGLSAVLAKVGIGISATLLGAIAGIATVAVGLGFALQKMKDTAIDSGSKLSNAMFGSAKSLENMAKAFDRMTPSKEILQQQAEQVGGARISEEAKATSSQFMQSEAGKQMLKDLALVQKMGESQATALKNQLAQAVISGVITTEEAQQIAIDVGSALNDSKLAINVTGDLTELFGPNGELIKENRLEILAKISASMDEKSIIDQVEKQRQVVENAALNPFITGYDLGLALQNISGKIFGQENIDNAMKVRTLSNNIIENATKEREIRAQITLEYQKGLTTFKEYKEQMNSLDQNQVGAPSSTQFFKDSEMAGRGLKLNVSGGADYQGSEGAAGLNIAGKVIDRFQKGISLRKITSMLPGGAATAASQKDANLEGVGAGQVKESIDFINQVNDQFNEMLDAMNLTKKQKRKVQDFLTEEYEGSAEELNKLQMDIMSGRLSMASIAEAQRLTEYEPDLVERLDSQGVSALDATSKVDQLADPALRQRMIERQAEPGGTEYVDDVVEGYSRLQALPPEIVRVFKIDMGDESEILKFAEKSDSLIKQWNILSGLDPSLDKEVIFGLIAKDDEGNTFSDDEITAKTKAINQAMSDLESTNPSVVKKAELSMLATYNDMDPTSSEAQQALEQMKSAYEDWDSFSSGSKELLFKYDAQIREVDLELQGLSNLMTAFPNDPRNEEWTKRVQELGSQRSAIQGKKEGLLTKASVEPESDKDSETKSAFQQLKEGTEITKKYQKVVTDLMRGGVKPENIALVDQANLLAMSTSERKKAIIAMKEQKDIQNKLSVAMLSDEEQRMRLMKNAIKTKENEIRGYQRQIENVERLNRVEQERIDNLQRQTELDQRQISIRNRAIDDLTEKEDNVNKAYDVRFKTLDSVAKMNDRLAQQRQDRIALAGALTSGDFASAASAADTMSSNFAGTQIEDARDSLEEQRQATLKSLTTEVNGQLLTRVEIEKQIDEIEERIYQRNLLVQAQQDIIFEREQALKPIRDAVFALEGQKLQLARDLEDAEYSKWKTEQDGINATILSWNEYWKARRGEGGKVLRSEYKKSSDAKAKSSSKKMFGGYIKRAFGGSIFKGSSEAPPSLIRANTGMEVPGIGLSDKVPALLTPGEFIIRKSVAQANLPFLKSLNSNVFPEMSSLGAESSTPIISDNSSSTVTAPVYNNYSVNVNVAGTDASPNEIADTVINRIRMGQQRQIRGLRR